MPEQPEQDSPQDAPGHPSTRPAAERAEQASGAPVPGGTQVSPSAGPGRTAQDTEGRYLPSDEDGDG
jgi:hypothetical protein